MTVVNTGNTRRRSGRIAKNSILLFIRMFVLMVINLYAVRVLLREFGQVDFGVYQVIAGVVTTMTCLTSVFAISCQRFYSYAIGEDKTEDLPRIFSVSININIIFSALIFLIFESIGLWFLYEQSTIPPERMTAAILCFQATIFTFICSVMQIPFLAAIIAHEEMGYYTVISTVECILKLVVALLIGVALIDNLVFYGVGLLAVAIFVLLLYAITASRKYVECHYLKVKDKALYGKMLTFSGWTLFGSIANVGMFQGNTLLLSTFFSPIVNAAFGISLQINNAFNALCNSVVLAVRPVMIKSYAEENHQYLMTLFYTSSKFLVLVVMLIGIPLIVEMPFVLNLWLKPENVNANTIIFSRFIVVYVFCMTMHHPVTIIMQAAGLVKVYHLCSESILLLCLPISYVLFKCGLPPYATSATMVGVCITAHIVRVLCLKHYFCRFSLMHYLSSIILPGFIVAALTLTVILFSKQVVTNAWLSAIATCLLSCLMVISLGYLLVTNKEEKQMIKQMILSKIRKVR